ncbi:sigma-70 family RNA polymerase sigma factor [Oerskovia flava]|uniref:sigma-70 family RNA polymerase sigma factor n=1 Tax=Oerskovia flava TaxID=2986422 RepID=UPI002240070C|nr:sigma-70 family RNA polymerase sigma factor [Oerskovia sp. JB1-3-2]
MTQAHTQVWDEASSDAELITAARGGGAEAFGVLYERHAGAATMVARQYVDSAADADDVVADAFTKVYAVLQGSGGPDVSFRAYLFTVVRRLSYDLQHGVRRTRPTDDDSVFESATGPMASTEDPALADFERSVVAKAYETLPERWRAALWYTEVEGLSPAEIAPILGLTANGVAALAYRAREGLRQAYLQQHLAGTPAEECRQVNALLGSFVRGGLSKRETTRVEGHLADCGECRGLVLELSDVSSGMRSVIAPLVLGIGGLGLVGTALPVAGGLAGADSAAGSGTGGSSGGAGGASSGGGASGGAAGGGASGGAAGAGGVAGGTGAVGGTVAAGGAAVGAAAGTGASGVAAAATATGLGALIASSPLAVAAISLGVLAVAGLGVAAGMGAFSPSDEVVDAAPPPPTSPGSAEPADPSTDPATDPSTDPESDEAVDDAQDEPATTDPANDPESPTNIPPAYGEGTTPGGTSAGDTTPVAGTESPGDAADPDPTDPAPTDPMPPDPTPTDPTAPSDPVLDIAMGDVQLTARTPGALPITASNTGGSTANDVVVDLVLPQHVTLDRSGGTSGASVSAVITPTQLRCGAQTRVGDGTSTVSCAVGTLGPRESRALFVGVVANRGGEYGFAGSIRAKGIEPVRKSFKPAPAKHFGPEVTLTSPTVRQLANPGIAAVRLEAANTGDRDVTGTTFTLADLPAGVSASATTNGWVCSTGGGAVTCATDGSGDRLAAPDTSQHSGPSVVLDVQLLADGSGSATHTTFTATVEATENGTRHSVTQTPSLTVREPWEGAAAGVGRALAAQCLPSDESSRLGNQAVVSGSYTNTTRYRTVDVELEAAGSSSSSGSLAAGETAALQVPGGVRVPAGFGTYTLTTTIAGTDFTHTVPAGRHGALDCYEPAWIQGADVSTENIDGQIRLIGVVENTTAHPVQVQMRAPQPSATRSAEATDAITLDRGEKATLIIDTGATTLPGGAVTFAQTIQHEDTDGDRAEYRHSLAVDVREARIAPAVAEPDIGRCTFDTETRQSETAVIVTFDNTRSTLPVEFAVDGREDLSRTVRAGTQAEVAFTVGWRDETIIVRADGSELARYDIPGESCYVPTWVERAPVSVETTFGGGVIVGTFTNSTAESMTVSMSSGSFGSAGERTVGAGATAEFRIETSALELPAGTVVFEQSRFADGSTHRHTSTQRYQGADSTVRNPTATLQLGAPYFDAARDESFVEVRVVLDNSASNVPLTFSVTGAGDARVDAEATTTVLVGEAPGSGATYTVTAAGWRTVLAVEPFDEAPQCLAPWRGTVWYDHSESVSYNGANYDARNGNIGVRPTSGLGPLFWERVSRCRP